MDSAASDWTITCISVFSTGWTRSRLSPVKGILDTETLSRALHHRQPSDHPRQRLCTVREGRGRVARQRGSGNYRARWRIRLMARVALIRSCAWIYCKCQDTRMRIAQCQGMRWDLAFCALCIGTWLIFMKTSLCAVLRDPPLCDERAAYHTI